MQNQNQKGSRFTTLYWALFTLFAVESFYFAFTTLPNFDEQLYLFKGLQLATGATSFLEPYTFWWNKMVGSFAFWGWVQLVAGKGLFAPRFTIAILNIGAVYFLQDIVKNSLKPASRTLLIGLMLLSFPMISNWSVANSQVLVNFLLAAALWILSKIHLGWYRIILLAIVSALMVLTRENMVFFLPPTFVYLIYRFGWKKALWWAGGVAGIGGLWFAANYPNDVLLLTRFIPSIVLPNFDLYQRFTIEQNAVDAFEWSSTVRAVSYTLRMAPLFFWGGLAGTFMMLFRGGKTNPEGSQFFPFLVVLFWFLFLPHIWVTQSLGYCAYCLATYSGFFISIGAMLFLFVIEKAGEAASKPEIVITWLSFWLFAIIYLVAPMIKTSAALIAEPEGWNSGVIWLSNALINKFTLTTSEFRQVWLLLISIAAGTFWWSLIAGGSLVFGRIRGWKWFGLNVVLLGIFVIGSLSNIFIDKKVTSCRANVVDWATKTSLEIEQKLPDEPVIYINGEWAALPLLTIDRPIKIFKPQLNSNFSYSSSITDAGILRFGLWNKPLAERWRSEANVFFFDRPEFENFNAIVDVNDFRIYNYTYTPRGCEAQIDLYTLIRKESN